MGDQIYCRKGINIAVALHGATEIEQGVVTALAQLIELSPEAYAAAVESAMKAIPAAPPEAPVRPKRKARRKKKSSPDTTDDKMPEAGEGAETAPQEASKDVQQPLNPPGTEAPRTT